MPLFTRSDEVRPLLRRRPPLEGTAIGEYGKYSEYGDRVLVHLQYYLYSPQDVTQTKNTQTQAHTRCELSSAACGGCSLGASRAEQIFAEESETGSMALRLHCLMISTCVFALPNCSRRVRAAACRRDFCPLDLKGRLRRVHSPSRSDPPPPRRRLKCAARFQFQLACRAPFAPQPHCRYRYRTPKTSRRPNNYE